MVKMWELGDIVFLGLAVGLLLTIVGLVYFIVSIVRTIPESEMETYIEKETDRIVDLFIRLLPPSMASELSPQIKRVKIPLFILFLGLLIILASLLLALF